MTPKAGSTWATFKEALMTSDPAWANLPLSAECQLRRPWAAYRLLCPRSKISESSRIHVRPLSKGGTRFRNLRSPGASSSMRSARCTVFQDRYPRSTKRLWCLCQATTTFSLTSNKSTWVWTTCSRLKPIVRRSHSVSTWSVETAKRTSKCHIKWAKGVPIDRSVHFSKDIFSI